MSSTFDCSTLCIFGENPKNRNKCALITFNAKKREENVVAEIDNRLGCAIGCVNGESLFLMCLTVYYDVSVCEVDND